MKAITLTQPWATLVAIGAKTIETRSWKTHYRGPLAIHAAKGWTKEVVKLAMREPFKSVLAAARFPMFSTLPRGYILATCTLLDCIRTEDVDVYGTNEAFFGDFFPGRWAWMLTDIKRLPEPIPAKGALKLWECNLSGHVS